MRRIFAFLGSVTPFLYFLLLTIIEEKESRGVVYLYATLFSSLLVAALCNSRWWKREKMKGDISRGKAFSRERLEIIEKRWQLEDLLKKAPEESRQELREVIAECKDNLGKLDKAEGLLFLEQYENEVTDVKEQSRLVQSILRAAYAETEKASTTSKFKKAGLQEAPPAPIAREREH